MTSFADVSVLVTGGTRGIGRAIVGAFASAGAKVTFTGTNDAAATEAAAASGAPDRCHFVKADVSSADGCQAAVDAAVAFGGGLDVVVNNAGITRDQLLLRMSEEEWDRVQDVNLKGAFLTTKAAARRLMKSSRGRLINITSVVGLTGNAGQANYAASKAGLIGFTKSVAKELAGRGVTANAVAPGFIETDMTADLPAGASEGLMKLIPLARMGTAADVAEVVLFLASEGAGYVTGQVIPVDGGMVM
ncbi:MAG: 3-oxoacyl-[acyl-carrier-protein] reductase [Planctomycetota bacterium]|nr:3-oxoacyl-[acyl-carrier-protein] reductase [Planctomycetota bacterium]